jgi:hypothetical protein
MRDTKTLQQALGLRIESVIAASDDPKAAMKEIALEAERMGWIDSVTEVRLDDPQTFVMDLWTEHPMVSDRLNLLGETLKNPLAVNDLPDVLDLFR